MFSNPLLRRRFVRLGAVLLGLMVAAVLSLALVAGVIYALGYPNLPEIGALTDYRPKLPMRIYSADGVLLGEYGEERRNYTPIAQMPRLLRDAVVATEDAQFYEHRGVHLKGVVRAVVSNLLRGSRGQGGGTITMQVARNFYLSTKKSYVRKIYEALLAFKIESQLSKEQILEVYMNQIFLGQRAYGFASASEIYFGKPLADLNIAETAMLAGLPQAPVTHNPIVNPKRAYERQHHVLDRMLARGIITAEQRDAAGKQVLKFRAPSDVPVHAEYVAELARQLIYAQYGDDAYRRGLDVYLTVNAAEQQVAYRALRKGILDYVRKQPYRGPEDYVDLPADRNEWDSAIAEALVDHPDNDELKAGVVLEASRGKVVAALQNGDWITVTGDGLKPVASALSDRAGPKVQIRTGSVVRLVQGEDGNWTITQQPEVQGAFVSLDPKTGAVRALVGGFDYSENKFNHVTQAWRQPGSTLKPFIYSAALEKGFTPSTVVNDAPVSFDAEATGGQPWEPKNSDGRYDGPMSLRTALAKSKNMVSIRILQSIGVPYAQEWLGRFGFDVDKHPQNLTMALGAGSVTPMQMALGYAELANGGYRRTPFLITRLTDGRGKVLGTYQPPELTEDDRGIEPRNAFLIDSLLQEVTRSGTAAQAQARLKRPDIYGKTGTTNDAVDAWFAGFQPGVVAVVWIGYDNPRKLGDRESGGGLALPIWLDYMGHALKGVPVAEVAPPDGVVNVRGEWYYDEYTLANGVSTLGLDDKPAPASPDEERKSILDLFKH